MTICTQRINCNYEVQLENVSCDFCGCSEHKVLFYQKDNYINAFRQFDYAFPIVSCRDCGLIFVNPRPTKETIGFFYPDTYHDERRIETMAERYEQQGKFLPDLKDGHKFLDVGCAKGDFLAWLSSYPPQALMYQSIEMFGCDAYSGGVREEYAVHFTGAALPDCQYPDNYFNCVTAWAVLEHVHTPKLYFEEIFRILKPTGSFVFLVPNFNSLMCRVAQRDDIARHIYQFTPQSIVNYLTKSGFRSWNMHFDDSIFDGRGTGALSSLFGYSRFISWLDGLLFSKHWETLFKVSGTLVIVAQK